MIIETQEPKTEEITIEPIIEEINELIIEDRTKIIEEVIKELMIEDSNIIIIDNLEEDKIKDK